MATILLTDFGGKSKLADSISEMARSGPQPLIAVASAYLTVYGAKYLQKLKNELRSTTALIVPGISGEVTQPNAIHMLRDNGWTVRLGEQGSGIFHPKLLLTASNYSRKFGISNPSGFYMGSANFTGGGLLRNTEIGIISSAPELTVGAAQMFSAIWDAAIACTDDRLQRYEKEFSRRTKARSLSDLRDFGIVDSDEDYKYDHVNRSLAAIDPERCSSVWVGLQSFTGAHTFQVEIPSRAGAVLRNILGTDDGRVSINCADGSHREMMFAYYTHNGMYRLNIPNDVPLVSWARGAKAGILYITQLESGELSLEIFDDDASEAIQQKSFALGTWGETSTRYYGWF